MGMRLEKDSMGEMQVPDDALYGAQTARAIENFQVSGAGIGRRFGCAQPGELGSNRGEYRPAGRATGRIAGIQST